MKVFKDQLEKQPIKSKVKNPNFNNVSFKNLHDDKSMKVLAKSNIKMKLLITHNLILLAHLKSILLNLKILFV